jgi:hypothetical protein
MFLIFVEEKTKVYLKALILTNKRYVEKLQGGYT